MTQRTGRKHVAGLTALACALQALEYHMFFFWGFRDGIPGLSRWYDVLVGAVILVMVPGTHCLWVWDRYGPRAGTGAFRGLFRSAAAFAFVALAGFAAWAGSSGVIRVIAGLFA